MRNKHARLLAVIIIIIAVVLGTCGFVLISESGVLRDKLEQIAGDSGGMLVISTFNNSEATAADAEEDDSAANQGSIYYTDSGFPIISYSDAWPRERLSEIYDELLQNEHGEELQYVEKVVLYPDDGDYTSVNGTLETSVALYKVKLKYLNVLPKNEELTLQTDKASVISLYNCDTLTTVAELAHTLSHEYGHHYTMYHFLGGETAETVSENGYYAARGLSAYPKATIYGYDDDQYVVNHEWDIRELAAEDYVQLLGSKTAKTVSYVPDIKKLTRSWMLTGLKTELPKSNGFNIYPQENSRLPLASTVEGLYEYYSSFLPESKVNEEFETLETMSAPYVTCLSEELWSVSYFTPYRDAVYTVLCYSTDGTLIGAVSATDYGEGSSCYVGSYSEEYGGYVYSYSDNFAEGTKIFRVTALLSDGRIVGSKECKYNFAADRFRFAAEAEAEKERQEAKAAQEAQNTQVNNPAQEPKTTQDNQTNKPVNVTE